MTSKPKIHMLVIDDYITDVVTHVDYRALEEELAALRGKVGELVEADRAFDAAHEPVDPPCNLGVDYVLLRKCLARRKRALEDMK